MADFRKMFYALAIVALVACFTVPAGAQSLNCTDFHGTNQIIRVEGFAELPGDLVLNCSGTGQTTPAATLVPTADITITIPSTTITSKIINPGSSTALSEATLIIDDLRDPTCNLATCYPGSRPHLLCDLTSNPGGLGVCPVTSDGIPNDTYNGTAGHPNMFVGRPNGASAIVFPGVPIDPPSTGFTRTFRIVNIRVNGTVFDPTNPFQQVIAIISFQGPASVGLNSIQAAIATVSKGMGATKVTADNTFLQCDYPISTEAAGDATVGTAELHGYTTACGSSSGQGCNSTASPDVVTVNTSGTYTGQHPVIQITEGFLSAWKQRNLSEALGGSGSTLCGVGSPCNGGGNNNDVSSAAYTTYNGTTTFNPADIDMNNPQIRYFTEDGFTDHPACVSGTCAITYFGTTSATSPGAGVADWGTRIQLTVSGIPNGTVLSMPTVVQLKNGSLISGVMVMTSTTTANGKGPYTPVTPASGLTGLQSGVTVGAISVGYVDLAGPSATVTYEVLYADPSSVESAKIYPILYYPALSLPSSVLSDLPQANASVQVTPATFAPYYATTGNQITNPLGQTDGTPRFTQTTGATSTLLTITRCTCSLLFPWVVSDANYVTGIAVANTSKDPTNGLTPSVFGYTATQSAGKVSLYLFGTIGGVSAQTNTSIAAVYPAGDTTAKAGSYATFIVNTGFTGYAITQANFLYCHGLAFVFNATGAVPPISYLGLTLDAAGLGPRTTQIGDPLVH